MPLRIPIKIAARIINSGGVVAYPTEGVFGFGCLPDDVNAVARILSIKKRDPSKGLILIAADQAQLAEWLAKGCELPAVESLPTTWVAPASAAVPSWIRGRHAGVAVRITSHPIANALCKAADSALVSTSANTSGRPASRNPYVLRRQFHGLVDYVVPGRCGPVSGPTNIRDLITGKTLR